MKVKTYLNTKCTPCRPFVKRFVSIQSPCGKMGESKLFVKMPNLLLAS